MLPDVFAQAQALTTLGGRPLAVLTATETLDRRRLGRRPGPARGALDQPPATATVDRHPRRPARGRRPARPSRSRAITEVVAAVRTGTPWPRSDHPPTASDTDQHHPHPEESHVPPLTPTPTHRARTPTTAHDRPGPCWPSRWPPRSWSCSTSRSSTPRCPPSAARWTSRRQLQWLVTAYLMMSGGGLLLGGRIADLLSRRRVFLTGLVCSRPPPWSAGSPTAAPAHRRPRRPGPQRRAASTPSALSLIMTTYAGAQRAKAPRPVGRRRQPRRRRRRARSAAPSPPGRAGRSIFWVNVPIGVVALVVAATRPRRSRRRTPGALAEFDLPGAAAAIGGLGALDVRARRHRSPRLDLGPHARALAGSAVPADRVPPARAAGPPSRCSRRTPGRSRRWSPARWSCSASPASWSARCSWPRSSCRPCSASPPCEAGLAFLPFAARAHRRHPRRRPRCSPTPRPAIVAAVGLVVAAAGAVLLSRGLDRRSYAPTCCPACVVLGLGAGMVFVAGLGLRDGRDPRPARRDGLRVPDDRARGRRRPGRRRPLRGRHHRRQR